MSFKCTPKKLLDCQEVSQNVFDTVIVRYAGEIGIKGRWTRRSFEKQLLGNIKRLLRHHKICCKKFFRKYGRIYIKSQSAEAAAVALSRVFGIASLSSALETTSKLRDVVEKCLFLAGLKLRKRDSFAVRCRRVGEHSYTSLDVCIETGRRILSEFPELSLKVDLENPEVELGIEIRDERAFIYTSIVKGVGGLPLGTQPKVICLLSGGIDSPVACWLVMKRGCPAVPVYFDNSPYTDESTSNRAFRAAEAVFDWAVGFPRRMYVVPHGQNLSEIIEKCPERMTCILCKRMMYRIAERIADVEGAEGIVTGEAIGEQASQTLRNLRVLTEAAEKYPIHRPLLGFDKTDTVKIARKIGTFEITTQRAKSCEAVPSRPMTFSDQTKISEGEEALNIGKMIDRSISSIRIVEL